jgi:hypothetical protein
MASAEFKPAIPATKQLQTYTLYRSATGNGVNCLPAVLIVDLMYVFRSRGSCQYSLTTVWATGRSGFDPRQGQRIFPLTSVSRPPLPQSDTMACSGTAFLFNVRIYNVVLPMRTSCHVRSVALKSSPNYYSIFVSFGDVIRPVTNKRFLY